MIKDESTSGAEELDKGVAREYRDVACVNLSTMSFHGSLPSLETEPC